MLILYYLTLWPFTYGCWCYYEKNSIINFNMFCGSGYDCGKTSTCKKTETENRLLRITIGGSLLLFLSLLAMYYFKKKYTHQLQELENLIRQINELENKEKEMENSNLQLSVN